ncbi:envelope glycoprotein [Striga asiatica]|uniref:Envelope glycoprotein n=1 Tax=Striga asiatica TaxID=4170 RepID=A0A5A7RCN7_STRAF|nr:envelope glycoprotein [Striga asiatica]
MVAHRDVPSDPCSSAPVACSGHREHPIAAPSCQPVSRSKFWRPSTAVRVSSMMRRSTPFSEQRLVPFASSSGVSVVESWQQHSFLSMSPFLVRVNRDEPRRRFLIVSWMCKSNSRGCFLFEKS